MEVPKNVKIICYYRKEELYIAHDDSTLKPGDEVVLLADSDALESLQEKWPRKE